MRNFYVAVLVILIILCFSSCLLFPLPKSALIDDLRADYSGDGAVYPGAAAILSARGYDVFYSSEVGFKPTKHSIIIVAGIAEDRAFDPGEMNQLNSFFEKGGKLLLVDNILEPLNQVRMNALASGLGSGIRFEFEAVFDNVNNYNGLNYAPTTTQFQDNHPLTKALEKVCFFFSSHITLSGNAAGIIWAESTANVVLPLGESTDLDSDIEIQSAPPYYFVAASTVKNGIVIGISSPFAFHDVGLLLPGLNNTSLFENIIDW